MLTIVAILSSQTPTHVDCPVADVVFTNKIEAEHSQKPISVHCLSCCIGSQPRHRPAHQLRNRTCRCPTRVSAPAARTLAHETGAGSLRAAAEAAPAGCTMPKPPRPAAPPPPSAAPGPLRGAWALIQVPLVSRGRRGRCLLLSRAFGLS